MTAKVKAIIATIIVTILIVLTAIGFVIGFVMFPEILGIFSICVCTIMLLGAFSWTIYCKMIEFFKD